MPICWPVTAACCRRGSTLLYDEPLALVDGKGCEVVDAEGRRYLDFFGGILTTMTGYHVDEVVEAVQAQAGRMLHTSTLYLIEPMIELAERLAELSTIPDAKVFFTTSGTEANEAALLLASTARRSNQVLALRNSYHGRSFATMGITGNRGWSASSLTPFVVQYLHSGDRFRGVFRDLPTTTSSPPWPTDLREVLATCTAGDVAVLIAEPIQGVGGFTVPPDGLFGALQEVLREHGHPVHLRRGADRLGPHRRPLLGLPGPRRRARHDHLRQGAGQRAPHGRGHRPRRPHGHHRA